MPNRRGSTNFAYSPNLLEGAFSEVVPLLVYPGARRSSTDRVVGKRTGEL